jgi:hypothetical protein
VINVTLKQKEAKPIKFVAQADGAPMNLSGATLFFGVKQTKNDTSFVFSKDDTQFDKSKAADGIVAVFLDTADTNQVPGAYVGELKIEFLDGSIDRSDDLNVVIEQAVIN